MIFGHWTLRSLFITHLLGTANPFKTTNPLYVSLGSTRFTCNSALSSKRFRLPPVLNITLTLSFVDKITIIRFVHFACKVSSNSTTRKWVLTFLEFKYAPLSSYVISSRLSSFTVYTLLSQTFFRGLELRNSFHRLKWLEVIDQQ